MTAKIELKAATKQLERLNEELVEKQSILRKLESSTDVNQLARQVLGGGMLHDGDGPIRNLQSFRFRCEVLTRAIELKKLELNEIQRRVEAEEIDELKRSRDAVLADIYLASGQITELFSKLERISVRAAARNADSAEFDAVRLFACPSDSQHATAAQRLASQLASLQSKSDVATDSDILPFQREAA